MKIFPLAVVSACFAVSAFAQGKAPAADAPPAAAPATAAAPAAEMPKHACVQPVIPNRDSTVAQAKKFEVDADLYRACMIAFSGQMQAESAARIKAANAAVDEYNGYAKKFADAAAEADKADAEMQKARAETAKNAKNAKSYNKRQPEIK
ncbi:MAG: hypothetical protein HY255_01500 [Betaproteobacteria bacterium]|nr:hypothetical protein [Betaproteobacteria bacterium]